MKKTKKSIKKETIINPVIVLTIAVILLFSILAFAGYLRISELNDEEVKTEEFCSQNNFDGMTFTTDDMNRQYFCTKDTLAIPLAVNDDGVWIVPQIGG